MKELNNKNAEEFRDVAAEYAAKCGYDGKAVTYALMAVAVELDELNIILEGVRTQTED